MDASTKRCSGCGEVKPLHEFNKRAASRDGHQPRCRACNKAWYREHAPEVSARTRVSNLRRRDAARALVDRYLLCHPCVDCGEPDLRVLDFDHQDRASKTACVSLLIARGASPQRLLAEIAKCDVRCANCHRRKTISELGWWLAKATARAGDDADG